MASSSRATAGRLGGVWVSGASTIRLSLPGLESSFILLQRGVLRFVGGDEPTDLHERGIPALLRRVDQRHTLHGVPHVQQTPNHVLAILRAMAIEDEGGYEKGHVQNRIRIHIHVGHTAAFHCGASVLCSASETSGDHCSSMTSSIRHGAVSGGVSTPRLPSRRRSAWPAET